MHSRGLNDLFFICNFRTFLEFRNVMYYLDKFIEEKRPLSSEYFLYHFVKKNSLKIKIINNLLIDIFDVKNKSHKNYKLKHIITLWTSFLFGLDPELIRSEQVGVSPTREATFWAVGTFSLFCSHIEDAFLPTRFPCGSSKSMIIGGTVCFFIDSCVSWKVIDCN